MSITPETRNNLETAGTLYLQRPGTRLHLANGCFSVESGGRELLRPPLHEVKRIVLIGRVEVSRAALDLAMRQGIPLSLLSAGGQYRGMLTGGEPAGCAKGSAGEHALAARREQWRLELDDASGSLAIASRFVHGKLENTRSLLLKSGRRRADAQERGDGEEATLKMAASIVARTMHGLTSAESPGGLLGHEGTAGRAFFAVLRYLIVPAVRPEFTFTRRTRRPPRDRFNALLSFLYALLASECAAAVRATGLEPAIGFLHRPRLGRDALALDLMEELRPALVDRLALALVNRRQIAPEHFRNPTPEEIAEEGDDEGNKPPAPNCPAAPPVHLNEQGRIAVLAGWRQRLAEQVHHPGAGRAVPWRMVPYLQANELANALARGEGATYRPFCPRF